MSLLEQDTIRKKRVEIAIELDESDSKEYEVNAICNNAIYAKKLDSSHHLPCLYYLVSWKSYLVEEKTWELVSVVLYFCKLISTFYCDYPEKPTATFLPIVSTPLMARTIAKLELRPQAPNKSKAGLQKIVALASALKRPELPVFYLVFGLVLIAGKRFSQSRDPAPLRFAPEFGFSILLIPQFSLTLWLFLLGIGQEVFSTKSARSFGFLQPVSQKVRGFSSIDPLVFLHYLLQEF